MNIHRSVAILLALACTIVAPKTWAQDEEKKAEFSGRVKAEVMSYRGARWLERETRDEEERPYEVIEKMKLKNGDVVVDMGVGTGYYGRKIAREIAPDGMVLGVDIQPEMLEFLKQFCEKEGITNVKPILGEVDDPKLPDGAVDWIIMADVYHEFEDPQGMLAKMHKALKPDGKVALLEYRLLGETARHIKTDHRMSVEQVLAEWQPAGFELQNLIETLPSQHFFIFGKETAEEK